MAGTDDQGTGVSAANHFQGPPFTADSPCPLCGGNAQQSRNRCAGWISSDKLWLFCSSKKLSPHCWQEASSKAYSHRLISPPSCDCGFDHEDEFALDALKTDRSGPRSRIPDPYYTNGHAHGPVPMPADLLGQRPGAGPMPTAGRPAFQLHQGEGHKAVDFAVQHLVREASCYRRAESLVFVCTSADLGKQDRIERDPTSPVISAVSSGRLWEDLSRLVQWEKWSETRSMYLPTDPSAPLVSAVHTRKEWPGLPELVGTTTIPVLRKDGSLVDQPGFDKGTGLFYQPTGVEVDVPERPTFEEALEARDALLEIVCDVLFESRECASAYLAAILSVVGKPAYRGNAPFFAIDSNNAGTGKSRLTDVVGIICTGNSVPRSPWVEEDNEMRKRITGHVLAADQVVMIDNVPTSGQVGWPSLDLALTGERWNDRILGKSENANLQLLTVWFVTGNNLSFTADVARRTLRIRILSDSANPQERTGFRHPDLLGWVRSERGRLLSAVITILRAFIQSGCPGHGLPPMGSFESWDALIRAAVIWVGLPDPLRCSVTQDTTVDAGASAHIAMMLSWEKVVGAGQSMNARDFIARLEDKEFGAKTYTYEDEREAVAGFCPQKYGFATAKQLGDKLRTVRDRWQNVGDRDLCFICEGGADRRAAVKWTVKSKVLRPVSGTAVAQEREPGDDDEEEGF